MLNGSALPVSFATFLISANEAFHDEYTHTTKIMQPLITLPFLIPAATVTIRIASPVISPRDDAYIAGKQDPTVPLDTRHEKTPFRKLLRLKYKLLLQRHTYFGSRMANCQERNLSFGFLFRGMHRCLSPARKS